MKWYLKVMHQYADFTGRARRKEYFMFGLFNALFGILIMIVGLLLNYLLQSQAFIFIYVLYLLATLIPSLAVSIRRMHDIGKSGWMMLVSFIPLVGAIWMLVLLITESEPHDNQYGPNPKQANLL